MRFARWMFGLIGVAGVLFICQQAFISGLQGNYKVGCWEQAASGESCSRNRCIVGPNAATYTRCRSLANYSGQAHISSGKTIFEHVGSLEVRSHPTNATVDEEEKGTLKWTMLIPTNLFHPLRFEAKDFSNKEPDSEGFIKVRTVVPLRVEVAMDTCGCYYDQNVVDGSQK